MGIVNIFRTDVETKREAELILYIVSKEVSNCKVNFDLEDCDNILRVESEKCLDKDITDCMVKLGYICEKLD